MTAPSARDLWAAREIVARHDAYLMGLDRASVLTHDIASALARARAEALEEAASLAEYAHPADADCCFEDPNGHFGRMAAGDEIASKIRALAAAGGPTCKGTGSAPAGEGKSNG